MQKAVENIKKDILLAVSVKRKSSISAVFENPKSVVTEVFYIEKAKLWRYCVENYLAFQRHKEKKAGGIIRFSLMVLG